MHNILCHMHRVGGIASGVGPSLGRPVVNNVKTLGCTPYRIPAGKYDDARKSGARLRRVLFSISVMHTIVTRIGTDCWNRRAPHAVWRMALELGPPSIVFCRLRASTVLTVEMKHSLGWMNKSNRPTTVIQSDRSAAPLSKNADYNYY